MTRIASQTRILWILFIYPCNIRVIRVPIVPIISTRMTRIAAQARILWILFIYPCNIRVIRVLIHPVNEIRIYLCSFFLSLSNNLRRNSGFLPKFKSKPTSILVARR